MVVRISRRASKKHWLILPPLGVQYPSQSGACVPPLLQAGNLLGRE